MGKLIVYIGSFSFPLGDAIAKRALGIGKSLSLAGYNVAFIGEEKDVPNGTISEDKRFEQFKYCSIHKPASSKEHYQFRRDLVVVEQRLRIWNEKDKIAAVFFCGTKCTFFADGIVKICKSMGIPTVADSMDWLKIHTGNLVFDLIKQTDITYELCVVNRKADGILAISEYLANYYEKKGLHTIVIPPLSPYEKVTNVWKQNESMTFVYAGIPFRLGRPLKNVKDAKDRLDLAILIFYKAHQEKKLFKFVIYGLTQEAYCDVFPSQKSIVNELVIAKKVKFMGYLDEKIVRAAVEKADFTVLLREKNRTSMAGFPTKISESIALGTPVITTDTSDIKKYISDGWDGFLLDITDVEKASKQMIDILSQKKSQSKKIKETTKRNVAFLPETYASDLKKFVDAIIGNQEEHYE